MKIVIGMNLTEEQQQMFRQFSEAVQNENRSEGNAHGQ